MTVTQQRATLRYLAKEYAAGRLDLQAYRLRREQLLNELAAYTPPPPIQRSAGREQSTSEIKAARSVRVKRSSPGKLLLVLFGLIALAAVAVTLLLLLANEKEPSPESQSSSDGQAAGPSIAEPIDKTPYAPPPEAERQAATQDPIEVFLAGNDWGPERRDWLTTQWDRLSAEKKSHFSSTSRFRLFRSELRTLIEEERGLAGGKVSANVDALLIFASRLGLDFTPVRRETPQNPPPPVQSQQSATAPGDQYFSTQKTQNIAAPIPVSVKQPEPAASSEAVQQQPKAAALTTAEPALMQASGDTSPKKDNAETCRPAIASRKIFKCQDPLKDAGQGPKLQLLPAGRFDMGSNGVPNEAPKHSVHIGYPFAIGTYEVSQREYAEYTQARGLAFPPQPWPDADLPVVNVSRDDAKGYAQWLSQRSGYPYRLPTEAEWEYAARAGTATAYPMSEADLSTYAHYSSRELEDAPLPRKPQRTNPNRFDIFHMAGNVREWVMDSWSNGYAKAPIGGTPQIDETESRGVVRGGSYADDGQALRSSARQPLASDTKDRFTGFRVVRDVYPKPYHEDLTRWGGWWLTFQQDEQLTLQLAASNDQNELLRLLEPYPKLGLQLVASNQATPEYLLLLGVFDSTAEALSVYQRLPAILKGKVSNHRVRSFGELR